MPKGFHPLDESTAGAVDDLWAHPYPSYTPDPRKKLGLGSVDWFQNVVGLPGGVGFAAEDDDPVERLRAEADAWGLAYGQEPEDQVSVQKRERENSKVELLRSKVKNIKYNQPY
jgi:hypothetical protein